MKSKNNNKKRWPRGRGEKKKKSPNRKTRKGAVLPGWGQKK